MKYNIPKKFTEETRIMKIFTKKSLIYTVVGLAISIALMNVLMNHGHTIIGLLLVIVFTLPLYGLGTLKYPNDTPYNGGDSVDIVFFRYLKNKLLGREVFTCDIDE